MVRSTLALASILALGGCAGTVGVQPAGPDSWFVSEMRAPVLGGGPAARDAALNIAEGFCAQFHRVPVPLEMGYVPNPYRPGQPIAFNTHFRCLTPDDPAVISMRSAQAKTPTPPH